MADPIDKAAEITDEAVGQARGATPATPMPPILINAVDDWVAEAEASIVKNPLLSVIIAAAAAVGFGIAKYGRLR
jgi:hypothetical protein